MKMFAVATNLDFNGWARGLLSAGISGGASAVTGGLVVSGMDPSHYNFQAGKFYILVGTLFMANAVVSIAKFLQTSPIPGLKQVETTIQKTIPATPDSPKIVETVKETHIEPISKVEGTKGAE
jgi:hypothetical protein